MTHIGAGGIRFALYDAKPRFLKELKKLDKRLQELTKDKIKDVLKNPFPSGLAFEKLKGYSNPALYSFHVTGNYKVSLEIKEQMVVIDGIEQKVMVALLRRVATHNEIDRAP